MMSNERIIGFTELKHLDFEPQIACDYDEQFHCNGVARFEMRVVCECQHKAVRLACGDCMALWMGDEVSAECPVGCGHVDFPARKMFWYVGRI